MEKDKYYVPDIEDFRVGYEYEFNGEGLQLVIVNFSNNDPPQSIGEIKELWEKRIFRGNDWDIMFPITEGLKANRIRTLYLTQEQIEDEGWEGGVKSNKKGYIYSYMYKDKQLIIKKLSTTPFPDEVVFSGECKSINEFRYICKLLKI